jgi:ketosteroid isomerase-like protein
VPVPTAPTAEWYRVRDGRIAAIKVFFDARPFAPLFEGR